MRNRPSRREALKALCSLPLCTTKQVVSRAADLPHDVPRGVGAIIRNTLAEDPASLNTDWFGTTLLQGLLEWHRLGVGGVRAFATAWLDHHINAGTLSPYSGARSREVVAGGIHITTYAGHYGLALPCYEMAVQFKDERARLACIDVGRNILHQAARNRLGMVEHDDSGGFAIPDTCYFVVRALMSAAVLDTKLGPVYREQAHHQLRTYIDTFLTHETGLAKTILFKEGLGRTCWTRASGWLLWAINSMLRLLPPGDAAFAGYVQDLKRLAAGMKRTQDASGGFRVLLDDPQTPLETTGTAMFASGVHEAVRNKWLPSSYGESAGRAWEFVQGNIREDGSIRNAYTGWALPAEQRVLSMDKHKMGWIPGFILIVANEMAANQAKGASYRR
jgi:rhamnogalacturonyl hydrolase YesR